MDKETALKILRERHDSALFSERTALETLIPELQESEDERIRKTIYNCVKWYGFDSHFFKDVSQEECLAWLEKQGEQKQDPCDNCKDVMLNCHNFPCIKKRAFKQGKTVLEAIIDEKVDNANKVEQKNAWSEEDERIIYNLIKYCGLCKNISWCSRDRVDEAISWVKSLKDRYTWKPSEEQMSVLKEQCVCKKSTVAGAVLCELFHDLKKLTEE